MRPGSRPLTLPVTVAVITLAAAWSFLATGAPARREAPLRFNRDIRPLLATNCFQCHGPDGKERKAKLRLDTEAGVRRVFVAGRPGESEAWLRITSSDEAERMPPPDSHRELKRDEIELIGRWIEEGAKWEGHWAFNPPRRPPLPDVGDPDWCRDAIDRFVLARLEQEGLRPSHEADRARLLRRVTYDLTGLPPTLDEIDQFVADERPDAFERVVDRLLASPRHGERMAVAWMDAARYGDTSVFHADGPRDMWPWRDWVIASYNAGKPFDAFTVEQLAGDLLPEPTVDQLIATGFNRNNATTDEGGAIAEEFRVEYAVDRVKTTSMVWMGLTMECGQCHDHKYDPISQEEYYRFFAYFNQASDPGMQTRNGNQSPVVNVPNRLGLERAERLRERVPQLESHLALRAEEATSAFEAWLAEAEANVGSTDPTPGGALAHFPLDESEGQETRDAAGDGRTVKLHGEAKWTGGKLGGALDCEKGFVDCGDVAGFERGDQFSWGAWVKPRGKASGAPIARMDDAAAYRGWDLHCAGGRVQVHLINTWPSNAIKVKTKAELAPDTWQHVFVTYDGSSKASGVTVWINGERKECEVEQDGLGDTIRTERPLHIGRRNPGEPFRGAVDDVRIYARLLTEAEIGALAGADPIRPILATPRSERTPEQSETLRSHYLHAIDEPYRELRRKLDAVNAEIERITRPVGTVMVMRDDGKQRMTFILDRGSYDSPRKDSPVEPGTPAFLPPIETGAPPNRLGLARWIVRDDHPLTARVAVNRYWYMLFGRGLVETIEDFGSQGASPSHPDLLDWLAVEFIGKDGTVAWDTKRALRRVLLSATYRQTSRLTPELAAVDPRNELLARGPRFRLQGEFIRDGALEASGLLVDAIGGPGVKPYQPPGLWNEVSLSGNVRFVQDRGAKVYRRSMYTYWKRSAPAPSMTIFDVPSREKCALRRPRTNTPLQALVTLNDPQFVEAARVLAERAARETDGDPGRMITHMHRLVTSTAPREETLAMLEEAYVEELEVFRADPARATALLSVGDSPCGDRLGVAEHAALTVVASMVFNLDEALVR